MKTGKRKRARLGTLVFFVPMIVVVAIVLYGYFQLAQPGTLKVQAISVDRYLSSSKQNGTLQVAVTVTAAGGTGSSTNTGTTPASFTLTSGVYSVSYGTANWFKTPPAKTVDLPAGNTVYAVGVYEVIVDAVSITQSGFNSTQVVALHGVTPIIWINNSGSPVTLNVESVGNLPLAAGQNYTNVFFDSGSYTYSTSAGGSGTVRVD